jgi:hypothetical protein
VDFEPLQGRVGRWPGSGGRAGARARCRCVAGSPRRWMGRS